MHTCLVINQGTKEATVTRKPKWVEIDESVWIRMKSAAVLKRMSIAEALEEAIAQWLAE